MPSPSAPTRRSSSLETGVKPKNCPQLRALTFAGISQHQQQPIYCVAQAHITISTPSDDCYSAAELGQPVHKALRARILGHLDEVIRSAIENYRGAILVNSRLCKFQYACVLAPLCKSSGGCVTSPAEPAVLALTEGQACHSAPSETATELDAAFDRVRSALHNGARVRTVPRPRDRLSAHREPRSRRVRIDSDE